jgi:hypothetical protein
MAFQGAHHFTIGVNGTVAQTFSSQDPVSVLRSARAVEAAHTSKTASYAPKCHPGTRAKVAGNIVAWAVAAGLVVPTNDGYGSTLGEGGNDEPGDDDWRSFEEDQGSLDGDSGRIGYADMESSGRMKGLQLLEGRGRHPFSGFTAPQAVERPASSARLRSASVTLGCLQRRTSSLTVSLV